MTILFGPYLSGTRSAFRADVTLTAGVTTRTLVEGRSPALPRHPIALRQTGRDTREVDHD